MRTDAPGSLFCQIRYGRIDVEHGLSVVSIHNRFTLRCQQANIEGAALHDLRRTWVGDMLDAGTDIATVAELAGHSDVRTTQRYDRRPAAVRRAAAARISVPF